MTSIMNMYTNLIRETNVGIMGAENPAPGTGLALERFCCPGCPPDDSQLPVATAAATAAGW